jgi:hypothetical protein
MAFPASGISVSWGGTAILQVTNLRVDGASCDLVDLGVNSLGQRVFRGGIVDRGTLTVLSLGGQLGENEIGVVAELTIDGPQWSVNSSGHWVAGASMNYYRCDAILVKVDNEFGLGSAVNFTYQFKATGDVL